MTRLKIDHETSYAYELPVLWSSHLAHLTPRETARQKWVSHRILIEPEPTVLQERVDIFGNRLLAFSVEREYQSFRVFAEGEVEVVAEKPPETSPSWEQIVETLKTGAADLDAVQYAFSSPYAQTDETVRRYAAPSLSPERPVHEVAADLMHRVHADCRYAPGVTRIGDQPADILRMRQGVCQDFAHLMVAALRSWGLAARYVSGYLRTYPPPGQQKLVGCDATHAWVSVWCGDRWIEYDPTNDIFAGEDHVVIAWGRDFGDVSPLKGVITGGGASTLRVGVNVNPITPL